MAIFDRHEGSSSVEMRMHDYLRQYGYSCPTDPQNCAFQWYFKTELQYFEYMQQSPEFKRDFDSFMTGIRSTTTHWVDWFPVESELLAQSLSGNDDIHIVDVGGGRGHDLERFLARYPASAGHLILQDLSGTIANLHQLKDGIQVMTHDFFTAQPVKGGFLK